MTMFMIDKSSQTPVRLVRPDENISYVQDECRRKNMELRLQAITQEERDLIHDKNNEHNAAILMCQALDQYTNRIGHPFIVITNRYQTVNDI